MEVGKGKIERKKKEKKKKPHQLLRTIYVSSLPSCEVNSSRTLSLPPRSKQRDGVRSVISAENTQRLMGSNEGQ